MVNPTNRFGSRGGEVKMIQYCHHNCMSEPIEVAQFVTSLAPNNSRWRRFAQEVHGVIKGRSKAAIAAKADLIKFIQAM